MCVASHTRIYAITNTSKVKENNSPSIEKTIKSSSSVMYVYMLHKRKYQSPPLELRNEF